MIDSATEVAVPSIATFMTSRPLPSSTLATCSPATAMFPSSETAMQVGLLICAGMLEIAAQSVRLFPAEFHREQSYPTGDAATAEKPIGGKFWDGVTHICKSPYLFGLFLFILLYTLTSTWTYLQQSQLTKAGFVDKASRTAFFAKLDLTVNTLTLLLQVFVTGRLMKFLGVTVTLLFMPVLSLFGFAAMGFAPVLSVLAALPGRSWFPTRASARMPMAASIMKKWRQ